MAESDARIDPPTHDARAADAKRAPAVKRRWRGIAIMASLPLTLIGGVLWWWLANDQTIGTDNAYVQQDKVSVSAQVSGEIVQVGARENQAVKAGDILFRIDPEPFRIAIANADAAIAAAQVRVTGLQTDLGNTDVDITGAAEDVAYYQEQHRRQDELMQRGFTTRVRLEEAEHDLSDARSRLAKAQAEARTARAALATAPVAPGVNPGVLAAEAQKRRAMLDLSRTVVRAPISGTVSQAERLQRGQMMTSGLPALTIVANQGGWVEANFKETELARMKVGQPATLSFDAYPGMELHGHVASIGAGTGSEFSILPAQNANGNWVKVTQRVPVRIAIDSKPSRPLIAGLSTYVRVDTSD